MAATIIEAVGLALILFATLFKVFLADDLYELHVSVLRRRLEVKVDYLKDFVIYLIGQVQPNATRISRFPNIDGIDIAWEKPEPETLALRQAGGFRRWETALFVLGSLLLILAKLMPIADAR